MMLIAEFIININNLGANVLAKHSAFFHIDGKLCSLFFYLLQMKWDETIFD